MILLSYCLAYLFIYLLLAAKLQQAKSIKPKTRNTDKAWLIGHPCETVNGARHAVNML